jgi:hypothetical protein
MRGRGIKCQRLRNDFSARLGPIGRWAGFFIRGSVVHFYAAANDAATLVEEAKGVLDTRLPLASREASIARQ